jgi:hypothetical protein
MKPQKYETAEVADVPSDETSAVCGTSATSPKRW